MKRLTLIIATLFTCLSLQAMEVQFDGLTDLDTEYSPIKAQFVNLNKYCQSTRSSTSVTVVCSADLTAQEEADIVAWGESLGYTITVTQE